MSESNLNQNRDSLLTPKCPPGRGSRKARAFAAEIARLQALGYTLEAIRQALAEAGVLVSKSTVQREAARLSLCRADAGTTDAATPQRRTPLQASPAALTSSGHAATHRPDDTFTTPETCSAKEMAEVFMRQQITNPLIRAKEHKP
jgi:phage-related tail fiber protein